MLAEELLAKIKELLEDGFFALMKESWNTNFVQNLSTAINHSDF
jgi:hypothetical protein